VESAARVEKRREAAIAECDEDIRRWRNSAAAAARYEGRRRLLGSQHALVERVLTAAVEATNRKLSLCVNPEHLAKRAGELLSYVGNVTAEFRCRPPIAEQIAARLDPRAARVVADDDAPWGLTLVGDDGRLTIDDTVNAWLEAERAAIAITVCRRIEERS
jgi:hypothetical protein